MGMQDRDWYKQDFKRRQNSSSKKFPRPPLMRSSSFYKLIILIAMVFCIFLGYVGAHFFPISFFSESPNVPYIQWSK